METQEPEMPVVEDPHARMEKAFIIEYLRSRGYTLESLHSLPEDSSTRAVLMPCSSYTLESLHSLPEDKAKQLMTEASLYASAKLTELEARAHFVEEIHGVTSTS